MNATSLYVSTCRAMLGAAGGGALGELVRLAPYLRQALGCCACGALLRQPRRPSRCPHAVCRSCRPRRPACARCRGASYRECGRLRVLLQSYRRLCRFFSGTAAFRRLERREDAALRGGRRLVELVREGAGFEDAYEAAPAPPHAALPCVFAHSATQTAPAEPEPPPAPPAPPPAVYSVMCAGPGNKITIKRKPPDGDDEPRAARDPTTNSTSFKKPAYRSRNSSNKRKGCRCGNATATPGKLTCCGQRCPCYVESKACSDCKCKGCRNPHRADGLKVRPHIPQLDNYQLSIPIKREYSPSGSNSTESLEAESFDISSMDTLTVDAEDIEPSDIKVYTSQLREVSADLPATIMMDEDVSPSSPNSDDDSGSPRLRDDGDASSTSHAIPVHDYFIPYRIPSPCLSHQDNTSDIEVEV